MKKTVTHSALLFQPLKQLVLYSFFEELKKVKKKLTK